MSRCLLHKKQLGIFKAWLHRNEIEYRPGRGNYEVLQVMTRVGWQCIFDRLDAKEHYTVAWPVEPIVRRFIRASRKGGEQS